MKVKYLSAFFIFLALTQVLQAERAEIPLNLATWQRMGGDTDGVDEDSVLYYQTFEYGAGGWTGVDLTDPGAMWHRNSYNAYSGQSWWCADTLLVGYENNWLQYLISPPINLFGTSNPVLTCRVYWAVESPSTWGAYDGWDGCNVWASVTGGNVWEVLQPTYPAYTCQSLYSFGWRWEMGTGIPGWTGSSGGWVEASFDLSAYAMANFQLRFAFCSDEATCTSDNPSLIGFFVDNIEVRDGQTLYLSNFEPDQFYPDDLTSSTGEPYGDFWVLTEESYHSQTHSWTCDDQPLLSDALISPPISIPVDMRTEMSYWVYCDMPDADGDNDDYLDDYYYIEVAPAGSAVWTPLVYDWAHNGSQLSWVERTNGYWDGLPTDNIDLTPWAGQEIQIRFRVVTDDNNDGGQGEGLFIDDVLLLSNFLPENDVGAHRLIIPFPTYEDQDSVNCTLDLVNYGTENQNQVPAFWSVNGVPTALIPWSDIGAGETVSRSFIWTPPSVGEFNFMAYTQLSGDEDQSNDTSLAGTVEVTPVGVFEFGYDHRQITYMPEFYTFNFPQGSGPMVFFTPAADGIPGILYGEIIKAVFYSEGTFNLHIFSAGSPTSPGAEIYSRSVTIDAGSLYPNWAEIDITDVSYLQGGHPDFWVWLEITSDDYTPHITGYIDDSFVPGHFFVFDGQDANSTIVNFNIRAILTGTTPVNPEKPNPQNLVYSLLPAYPNPFNLATNVTFALPSSSLVQLDLFDALGRRIAVLLNERLNSGVHSIQWNAEGAPSGNYWLRFEAGDIVETQRVVLLK